MKLTTQEIKALTAGAETIYTAAERLFKSDDDELAASAYEVMTAAEKYHQQAQRVMEIGRCAIAHLMREPGWRDDSYCGPWYCGVNSLGELRGTATDFDIACALYDKAFNHLNYLIRSRECEERKTARAARRAEYTDIHLDVLQTLEYMTVNSGGATLKQLAQEMGHDIDETRAAVAFLNDEPEAFVVGYDADRPRSVLRYRGEM